MNNDNNSSWMISPRGFIRLLGAEYDLMRDAGLLKRFYISSLLIVVIMASTSISIAYAMGLLFHTIATEAMFSLFFGLLFICIYVFLLNTFAKENRIRKGILSTSNVIRIGFIAFMGFLIAQPLIIFLYTSPLSSVVENYKKQLLQEHIAKVDQLVNDDLSCLVTSYQYYTEQKSKSGTRIYDKQISKTEDAITSIRDKAVYLKLSAQQIIDHNSFFLYRVKKVNILYPQSWILALLIVMLFLLPGYLVYTISSRHEYYQLKKAQEKKLIMDAYTFFKMHYQTMFTEQISVFSRYEDPPFNTIRKQPPVSAPMTDFLKKYLDNV